VWRARLRLTQGARPDPGFRFAVRYDAAIKRWYQKKCASALAVVALKAVARTSSRGRATTS